MSKPEYACLFEAILDSMEKAGRYTENMEQGDFINDTKTAEATLYNVQVIAECARLMPEDAKTRFGHIPWDEMASLRDVFLKEREDEIIDVLWPFLQEELLSLRGLIHGAYKCIEEPQG